MHRHNRSLTLGFTVLLGLATAESRALAQGVTGSAVTGIVTDESGAPVEGTYIQLRNRSTGDTFTAVTGPSGRYFVDNVPPGGRYRLTATAAAYQMTTENDIRLTLGERLTINLVMHYQVQQ